MTILLFDCMDTLVHDPFFTLFPRYFNCSLEELYAMRDVNAWPAFESGTINEAEYQARSFLDKRSYALDELKQQMQQAYAWIDGMQELLAQLYGRYEMHIFSNYPAWEHLIEEKLNLSKYLDWSFMSYKMGHRKPKLESYQYICQSLKKDAKEFLFIDDRQKNIDAALAYGMDAILFKNCELLKEQLRQRHIIS